jgi:riboflavin transporter FmnP
MNNLSKRPAFRLTLIAVFSAAAFLLTMLKVPMFAPFLDFEMSELPVVVLGILLGPLAAAAAELIKNLIGLFVKPVANGLGQAATYIVTTAIVVPRLELYKKKRTPARFILAAAAATAVTTVVACIANWQFLIPLYAAYYGVPVDALVESAGKMNPWVSDYRSMILFAIAPFNILKGVAGSILGYFVVMAIQPALKKFNF